MMPTTVRRAVIIGVGDAGRAIIEKFNYYLRERHGDVPVIRTLVIDRAGDERTDAVQDINVSWDANDMARLREQADLSWLPEYFHEKSLSSEPRADGRLILFKYINHIQNAIRARLYDISRAANEAQLQAQNLTIHHARSTDFYLVGSLTDALFSGSFVDLAYLLYHLGREGATERDFVFVNGILLTPGFAAENAPPIPRDADAAQEQRLWRDAQVYAALRELDYFMNAQDYTCVYRPDVLTVTAETRPFHGGSCYLLTPFNENNRSLPRLSDAAAMAAEGLYQILLSPLKGRLEPVGGEARYGGKLGAYASFGVAALTAPMMQAADYCAWRLCTAWVEDYLLQDVPEDPAVVAQLRRDLGLTREQVTANLIPIVSSAQDKSASLELPFYRAHELEQRLLEIHERHKRVFLPAWQDESRARLDSFLADTGEELVSHIRQMLDAQVEGSVPRAHALLTQLRAQFQAEHTDLEAELTKIRRDIGQNDLAFDRALGRYLDAAAAYGAVPFVPLWFTLAVCAVLSWYTWDILSAMHRTALATGLIAVSGALLGGLLLRAYHRIKQSRVNLLELHARRIALLRREAQLTLLGELYDTFDGWSADLLREVTAFRDKLERLAQRCRAELNRVDWQKKLYGAADYALAQSVLSAADVEHFYQEVAGRDPAVELRAAMMGLPYHQWQVPEQNVARLADYLYTRARSQAGILLKHTIEEKLAQLSPPKLREHIGRMLRNAAPFWQCDALHLNPPPPAAQQFIALSLSEEEQTASALLQVLGERGIASLVEEGHDAHRMLCMTVQRGMPLEAIAVVRRCRAHYETLQRTGRAALCHVQKWNADFSDFPDLR